MYFTFMYSCSIAVFSIEAEDKIQYQGSQKLTVNTLSKHVSASPFMERSSTEQYWLIER